ncbi:hypothetical protein FOZ61_008191 [Perkinsus olseni]|uniref:Uncharacterized protein n=1 Tax=Perkinsus olseni TaxID=32597 RepID=A0A7J6L5S8_PEROL|nr:hypothetical protein FOZ61_008191 [Perkinsus olseni]
MGRNVTYWGAWNSTLYGFRVAKLNSSTGGSSSDDWADSDPVKSIRVSQFLSAGRALTLAQIGQVPDCFHVEPKGAADDFILGLYSRLGLVKPLRVASQLVFCQTEIGMIVGIGKQLNTNRDRNWKSTTYGFRIALSESSRGGMADDVQEISRKRSSVLQAGGGPLKLAKRDEGSDASNGSAKSSYKSPVPGLALPESDYSRRGEDETGEGGSTSGMGDHSQPGVAFPRKAAIEEWEGEYGVPSDRVANRTSLRLLSGEGPSKFHRKGKLTSGKHVSADWPTSSFDVRNFNVRTSGCTGQSAEASIKFPESARRGADDQNYTTGRESSTPSENDLLLPIDFDDLWLDPEALLDEKWLETLSDSAGSIQSEGNTAEHHREINRGSTTKGADDLLSPMEFDSLWPETKASSDDKWVKALFDSAEVSSSLAPAVVSTEEWTSIPDGTYLATGTGLDQINKVTVNIRTDYPTHNRRAQLIFDTRGFECPMTLPEVTAVCLETCLQLDFSSEEHALDLQLNAKMSLVFPSERLRSLLVIETLATRYGMLLPADCMSDIWDLLKPLLTRFGPPETLAIDIQTSSCYRVPDGSRLLVLRYSSLCECVVLDLRPHGATVEHCALDVGFLLSLAVDSEQGNLIAIAQNTGRSCKFVNWELGKSSSDVDPTISHLLPSWMPQRTIIDCFSKPVFSSLDSCFYGLSYGGASVIRIGPDGSTSTLVDCGDRPARGLCVYQGGEEKPRILVLQRMAGRARGTALSAISRRGEVLVEVTMLGLCPGDVDVDNRRGLCFVVGHYDGSDPLTVSIVDLREMVVCSLVPLPRVDFCRFFVRNDGGLWFITRDRCVVGLEPIFL